MEDIQLESVDTFVARPAREVDVVSARDVEVLNHGREDRERSSGTASPRAKKSRCAAPAARRAGGI